VKPSPIVTATASPNIICVGGSSQLTASGVTTSIASDTCFTNSSQSEFDVIDGIQYKSVNVSGIPAGATITGITLTVNVDHQRDQEVAMYLLAPRGSLTGTYPYTKNGPAITLVDSKGGTGSNYVNTVFSDAGGVLPALGAPYTNTYQPVNSFASLIAQVNATGVIDSTWRFAFVDHSYSGYTGVYHNFTLCITYTVPTGGTYTWSPAT
jgi:hypothetical protein